MAAGCPTRDDLSSGIRLTRDEPFFSVVLTATQSGLSEAHVLRRGGRVEEVSTLYAYPLAVLERLTENGTLSLQYANDPAGIEGLTVGDVWRSAVTLFSDGTVVAEGHVVLNFQTAGSVTIADCTYATLIVHNVLSLTTDNPIRFQRHYAPELGLVVQTLRLNADGSPRSTVIYDSLTGF